MELLSARQKLVASNIANAATPGYKTKDIDFQFEFQAALSGSPQNAGFVANVGSKALGVNVIEPGGLKSHNDGNNVSLDREARMLSEIALRFSVASQLWRGQMRQVRAALQEGRNG